MKTIAIREAGDKVYFLSASKGRFVQGRVKRTFIESIKQHISCRDGGGGETVCTTIKYYVTCDSYNEEYMGDEKNGNELFDTKEEMIQYYLNKSEFV